MAQRMLPLLQITFYLLFITAMAVSNPSSTRFIKASCKATTYPTLCVKSISPYSDKIQKSPRKMAQTALAVGLAQAKSGKALVNKLIRVEGLNVNEYKALDVCLDQLDNSVDRFSQSVKELKIMGKNDNKSISWRISNVQTWVSAALTDQITCLDAFEEKGLKHKTKGMIISRVTNIKKVTSNALALVNKVSHEETD